jgi:hypothetical protein
MAFVVLAVRTSPARAAGGPLWDNELTPNGINGRAISPPAFPEIRLVDDLLTEGAWTIEVLRANVIEDTDWRDDLGIAQVVIRRDDGERPMPGEEGILVRVDSQYTRTATGDQYFGRADFDYQIDDLQIHLDDSTRHWIGIRNPGGSGAGTNYWMTSDGGPDGAESETGWFSLDNGQTWRAEGTTWHHAFEVFGTRAGGRRRPHSFSVTQGVRRAGGLLSLYESDDDRFVIEARRPDSVSRPSVELILDAEAGATTIRRVIFTLEASTTIGRLSQRIDLFNFEINQWERVDTREATPNDSVVEVVITENPGRFVHDGDGAMRARIGFWDPGIPIAGWFAHIDQAVWSVRGS